MAFSRFAAGVSLRIAALCGTVVCLSWMLTNTRWYVTIGLTALLAVAELLALVRYASVSDREVARFLDAIARGDTNQNFLGRTASSELGAAMNRVMELLRQSRRERDQEARYTQTVLAHVPVALITIDPEGKIDLLNVAARRLFGGDLSDVAKLGKFGGNLVAAVRELAPGATALVRAELPSGSVQVKVAASAFAIDGQKRRVISFQNIESELSARELDAWQNVIRILAHEVMNSLTPISSLSETALTIVLNATKSLATEDPALAQLKDACEALETVARRGESLLRFVQSHRRLTQRISANPVRISVSQLFAGVQRLFAEELNARGVFLDVLVQPNILEIRADESLVEQALINLVRNGLEAIDGSPGGKLVLGARPNDRGRIEIFVADNGPGVDFHDRGRVFMPFFTTKKQGSGVGLTLVRQIALAHAGTVELSQTPGGGATFTLTL